MESDFGRRLDPESVIFFRHHPVTVGIVYGIFKKGLRHGEDYDMDYTVIGGLTVDLSTYPLKSRPASNNLSDILPAFCETYQDAGNIVSQAVMRFFGRDVQGVPLEDATEDQQPDLFEE